MNELAESNIAKDLIFIDSIVDVNHMMEHLIHLKMLQKGLKEKHIFKENATKFAMLHAASLIRIVELGGIDELEGRERKTAEWLSGLSAEERSSYISKCGEGITIDQLWYREIDSVRRAEAKWNNAIKKAQSVVQDAISEANTIGVVDTEKYIEKIHDLLPENRDLRNDLVDGMRNKLLKAGALGVGFNSGVYIKQLPDKEGDLWNNQKDHDYWMNIRKAVLNRFLSISNDIKNLHSIILQSNIDFRYDMFISDYDISHEKMDFYQLSLLLMLCDMTLVSKDDLEDKLDRSWEYKSRDPYRSAKNYKTGREYFIGTMAEQAKEELQYQVSSEKNAQAYANNSSKYRRPTAEEIAAIAAKEGMKIKESRIKAGITQQQLANAVGIRSEYLSMVELGKKRASQSTRQKIWDLLSIGKEDEKNPPAKAVTLTGG